MDRSDIRNLPRDDQAVLAAGVLAFIASFFPYYGVTAHAFGHSISSSVTAWHSWTTLALLLLFAATAVAAVQLFAPSSLPPAPVSWNVVVAALSAVATVIYVLRSFTLDHGSSLGGSYGLRWGAYFLLILFIAHTAFSVMRVRAAGDSWSWDQPDGATAPPAG